MNRVKNGLAAALASTLLGACAGGPPAPTAPVASRAEVNKLEIKDQSFTEFTAVAFVSVPAGEQPIQAGKATFELLVNGEPRGSGTVPLNVQVPAGGGVVEVPARATYAEGDKLSEVMQREEPLPILLRGSVETSDGHVYEFSRSGRVRTPRVPDVKVWHVEAGAYPSEEKIGLVFFVQLENRNPFELQLEQMDYDLVINGKKMVAEGKAGRKERVPAASTAQLEIPLQLNKKNFPDVAKHIKSGSGLQYQIDGTIRLAVGQIPVELTGPIELGRGSSEE